MRLARRETCTLVPLAVDAVRPFATNARIAVLGVTKGYTIMYRQANTAPRKGAGLQSVCNWN